MEWRMCCVGGCRGHERGCTLFEVPRIGDNRYEAWQTALENHRDPSLWREKRKFVCDLHFKKEDFRGTPKRILLKHGTVPSVFENLNVELLPEPETIVLNEPEVAGLNEPEVAVLNEPEAAVLNEPEVAVLNEPEVAVLNEPEAAVFNEPEVAVLNLPEAAVLNEPEAAVFNEPEVALLNEPQSLNDNPIPDPDSTDTKVISIKEYDHLKYTQKVLNHEIRKLRNLLEKTKSQLADTKTTLSTMKPDADFIKDLKNDAEENIPQAVFIMDQIRNYGKKKNIWSEITIRYCAIWRYCSPKGYEFPRKELLNLPCKTTLNKYVHSKSDDQTLIANRLKQEAQILDPVEKLCSLVTDDMSIDEKISYGRSEDKLYGYGTSGSTIGRNPDMANKLLCFVIHGLTTKYTIPVGYFFHRHLNSEDFFQLTQKVLRTVTECGFIILRIVADNHQSNVSMFKHFGNGHLKISIPHPLIPRIPLFFSFDSSHIIKNGRNQYLEDRLTAPEGKISSEYLKLLYNMQKTWLVKPVKFLTKKHLYPSSLEKMKVLRAIQIFSPAVTAALRYLEEFAAHEYPCFANVSATVEYMETMYNFFQLHDVSNRTQHIHTRAKNTAPYTNVNDERLNWLHTTFPEYIRSIQGMTKETSEAMIFTAESTYQVVKYLLSEKGFYYVLTRSFNSDCIEATFSHIRLRCGSHDVTDARSAEYAIKQILKCGIVKSSSTANVGVVSHCSAASSNALQESTSPSTSVTTITDLPLEIQSMLNNFPSNCPYGDENMIYCSSVAFVAGYLVKKIEDTFSCKTCMSDVSDAVPDIDNTSLMGLLYLQDRGKLKYPKPRFVFIIYHIVNMIKQLLPLLLTDHIALQIIKHLQKPLENCGYFTCSLHKQPVVTLILDKLATLLLSNLCLNQNDSVRKITLRNKPKSRKILKLGAS